LTAIGITKADLHTPNLDALSDKFLVIFIFKFKKIISNFNNFRFTMKSN
jgi:hypothetical protein